ncbi:cleft lip and palate transmembrane protein 1-like protein [Cimex lectularius]|uniref:Lipid scramblase CLPTM1L n=1 Tax=Cimex lectularius TaxID=79782 RepID=A0A8I6RF16_CIMLE|nr:cleft lip and palate transmembrane protein 1-like protein [Cimex lectularius]
MQFSLTSVLSVAFIGWVLHSVISLVFFVSPPACRPGEKCYYYFTKTQPNLQMVGFISDRVQPAQRNVHEAVRVDNFDPNESWERSFNITIPETTRNNGTLFLHAFIFYAEKKIPTFQAAVQNYYRIYSIFPLVQYQAPSMNVDLLKGKIPQEKVDPISHLKQEATFNIVTGIDGLPPHGNYSPELIPFIRLGAKKEILPIMDFDYFSDRLEILTPVPKGEASIKLKYSPINIGKFRLRLQARIAFESLKVYGFSDKDIDQVKSVFSGTSIYFFGFTVFISSIHFLLEFLAMKSDVNFWNSKKNFVGLSVKTVCWRAFSQIAIFLYLIDEETSLIVIIPMGFSTLIEFWKLNKVMPFDWKRLRFKKVKRTAEEQMTMDFDKVGMKYLMYLLYPLCASGAVYSLFFLQHKSWYSWIIHSVVNGVYGFGFLFMLPQLFINYKLKSVAHLPWRTFMYKAFNTFIDDLFAFVIDMPIAHRLACFRDDIVFLIYLYQRWLYPVDQTRVDSTLVDD